MQKKFGLYQYREAKQVIKNAEIIRRYSDPCVCNTTYRALDGQFWFESESKLESPENDYELSLIENQERIRELSAG